MFNYTEKRAKRTNCLPSKQLYLQQVPHFTLNCKTTLIVPLQSKAVFQLSNPAQFQLVLATSLMDQPKHFGVTILTNGRLEFGSQAGNLDHLILQLNVTFLLTQKPFIFTLQLLILF